MIQNNEVEVYTKSNPYFYTLKGYRFDNAKPMTGNHTEVINQSSFLSYDSRTSIGEKFYP